MQRLDPHVGGGIARQIEGLYCPLVAPALAAAKEPERYQATDEPKSGLGLLAFDRPCQRRPQVVLIDVQPIHPPSVPLTEQAGLGLLREGLEELGMSPSRRFSLAARLQLFRAELADRLQHGV